MASHLVPQQSISEKTVVCWAAALVLVEIWVSHPVLQGAVRTRRVASWTTTPATRTWLERVGHSSS